MVALAGTPESTVGRFTSLTVTWIDLASLRLGEPLSDTRTVMLYTPGPWASVGVQVKTPVLVLMAAPAGAPGSRLKVSVCPTSGSVAVAVNVYSACSGMVTLAGTPDNTGGWLTAVTFRVIDFSSNRLGLPLSVTHTLKL